MGVPEEAAGDGERSAGSESSRVPDDGREPPRDADAWSLTGEASTAFGERDPEAVDDATELYLLDRHAASDGAVTVQLLGWDRDGDIVRVDYALPTGERRTDRYRWPAPGRYGDSDFLAMVRGVGYTPATADLVAGEFARARNENGRWRIVTGREPTGAASSGADRDDEAADVSDDDGVWTDRAAETALAAGIRRRVAGADPMRAGSVAVSLLVLAVLLPATLAVALGGATTWVAGIGAALFVASMAALGLSIAAVL